MNRKDGTKKEDRRFSMKVCRALQSGGVNANSDNGQGEKVTRETCPRDEGHGEGSTGYSDGTT